MRDFFINRKLTFDFVGFAVRGLVTAEWGSDLREVRFVNFVGKDLEGALSWGGFGVLR